MYFKNVLLYAFLNCYKVCSHITGLLVSCLKEAYADTLDTEPIHFPVKFNEVHTFTLDCENNR